MHRMALIPALVWLFTHAAVAAEYKWIGITVVSATTGCTSGWNPVGVVLNTLFKLPVAGSTNGLDSDFNIFDKTWATGFHLQNGSFASTFKLVHATVVGSGSGIYQASIRFTSQTPAVIATTTQFVTIAGIVKDFDFRTGCNISFKTSLSKSPF